MKPYAEIKVLDVYQNPVTGSEWAVVEKSDSEKMVQLTMLGSNNDKQYTMWKRNTDRIFNFPQVQYGS
jgi:predicted esterase YcpF (UPF0227 family)